MADKRRHKWYRQRKKRGFDDRDLWSLYITIAKFVLPRLKDFKDSRCDRPANLTTDKWEKCLDKMIYSMEIIASDKIWECDSPKKLQEGCVLFGKWFLDLWY